jgi:hypothetical protein
MGREEREAVMENLSDVSFPGSLTERNSFGRTEISLTELESTAFKGFYMSLIPLIWFYTILYTISFLSNIAS